MLPLSKKMQWTIIIFLLSFQLYCFSLIITKGNPLFTFRWVTFFLHIASISSIVFLYMKERLRKKTIEKFFVEKELIIFGFLLLLVEFISLLFLKEYPFISVYDEVRDGGLNAMQIASGSLLNIFGYGRYSAHGLIIPTITSFFYHIFGSSVLAYRLPAAFLSIFDVVVLFLLVRLLVNRTAAFFSAFVLASLPLHLFFARTQVVDAFNSFWSSVLLLSLFLFLRKQKTLDYAYLGTLIGFVFGFHAAIRVVAVLILLVVVGMTVTNLVTQYVKKGVVQNVLFLRLFCLILFCFIGFGPRLLFTNSTTFFHTSRLTQGNNIVTIKDNYVKSLMVWFYEPTTFVYPDHKPLFPPFLAIFFLLGLGYAFFILKKPFYYILIFLALTIPLFNSAITDRINVDYRVSPLMPIGSIFVGIGIWYVFYFIRNTYVRYSVSGVIGIYLLLQIGSFFINRPADKNYAIQDYLSMHIIYFIKSNPIFQNTAYYNKSISKSPICIVVSPDNDYTLHLLHYEEQYQYFVPNAEILTKSDISLDDSEAYIFNGTCPSDYHIADKQQVTPCNADDNNFLCPLHYNGNITIHY